MSNNIIDRLNCLIEDINNLINEIDSFNISGCYKRCPFSQEYTMKEIDCPYLVNECNDCKDITTSPTELDSLCHRLMHSYITIVGELDK